MIKPIKYLLFSISATLVLLVPACGPDTSTQEAVIQTSVAQTVAAQTTVEVANTATPSAPVIPTQTPFQLPTPVIAFGIPATRSSIGLVTSWAVAMFTTCRKLSAPDKPYRSRWY